MNIGSMAVCVHPSDFAAYMYLPVPNAPNKSPDGNTVSLLHSVSIYVTLDPLPPCILFRVDEQCAGSGADPALQAAVGNKNRLRAQGALTHDSMKSNYDQQRRQTQECWQLKPRTENTLGS